MSPCANGVQCGVGEEEHFEVIGHIERTKNEEFV